MIGKVLALMVAATLLLGGGSAALADNVAFNKAVTLNGTFFTDAGGWALNPTNNGTPASLVDGIFLPEGSAGPPVVSQWNDGSVWWNQTTYPGNNITIDLGAVYQITGFQLQGDVNDVYRISYWDAGSTSWVTAYDAPQMSIPPYWGLTTRPQYDLGSPIYTNQLRVTTLGVGDETGDQYVGVSEIQAFGSQVPLPGAVWLLGSGLVGLLAWRRQRG